MTSDCLKKNTEKSVKNVSAAKQGYSTCSALLRIAALHLSTPQIGNNWGSEQQIFHMG